MIIGIIILILLSIYFVYEYCNREQIDYNSHKNKDEKEYDYILDWLYKFSKDND